MAEGVLADPAPEAARPSLIIRLLGCDREPDETIPKAQPGRTDYLRRWYIIPHARDRAHWRWLREGNAFLHHFRRSDDDRGNHDHPWWNISILLSGRYLEHGPGRPPKLRRPGNVVFRRAEAAHRVELLRDAQGREIPVWTIFITGPKVREWGFLCPKGWRHNKDFLGEDGAKGQGCAE